jgi:hypothetical protein
LKKVLMRRMVSANANTLSLMTRLMIVYLIIKRDVYPLAASEDVYYRVKTVTKEGVTRAYPPVRLPALRDEKK